MNWSKSCYKPSFNKYWSGKIWNFSFYKYSISIDFRKNFIITDLPNEKEKKRFYLGMWLRKNKN